LLNKFKQKSEFARSVITLMTGTTIAQAIPIAISPILTRIYSPDDFGVFALYIGIVSIVSVFATGRYELAIILPKSQEEAINIVALSLMITTLVSVFAFIIIWLFHEHLITLLGNSEIAIWLYFIPLSVWFNGVYQALYYWINRNKDYKTLSKSVVLQASSNAVGNLSFGYGGFTYMGLIITNIITSFFSFIYMLRRVGEVGNFMKSISLFTLKSMLKQYKEFPLHTLPQNFVYQGSMQLPIFIIKMLYSFAQLGFFSLAYRVIVTPTSIVANSLGKVYYQKASEMFDSDRERLYSYTKSMFFKLLFLALVIGVPLTFYLPELFATIFGIKWLKAGEIAQFLMIYLIYDFALTPFTNIYLVSGNNRYFFKWELGRFLIYSIYFGIVAVSSIKMELFFLLYSLINLALYGYLSLPILKRDSIVWSRV